MPANSVKQHSPANFYNMAPQIGIFAQFRRSTMDNANKLAELNVKAWKMAIEDASSFRTSFLSLPNTVGKTNGSRNMRPQLENILSYGREASEIYLNMQADLMQTLTAELDQSRDAIQQWTEPNGKVRQQKMSS